MSTLLVLIIFECRSTTLSHGDLPFTHNTVTFTFACLYRHRPIRIHHTRRLCHAEFDLLFCSQTLLTTTPPCIRTHFLFVYLLLSLLLSITSSAADRQTLDESPNMSAPSVSFSPLLSVPVLLHHFSQPKRAKEGVASLSRNSSSLTFPLCFSASLTGDKVTFTG